MGLDRRIASKFLHAGPGFGGSCFPKDTAALTAIGQRYGTPIKIVETVIGVNEARKRAMAAKVVAACEALSKRVDEHIEGYGHGIQDRLTGLHETAPYNVFNYGVSDRGASVRIPWQVEVDGKGYLEDRRPNANCDPYVVTRLIVDTCCSALAA